MAAEARWHVRPNIASSQLQVNSPSLLSRQVPPFRQGLLSQGPIASVGITVVGNIVVSRVDSAAVVSINVVPTTVSVSGTVVGFAVVSSPIVVIAATVLDPHSNGSGYEHSQLIALLILCVQISPGSPVQGSESQMVALDARSQERPKIPSAQLQVNVLSPLSRQVPPFRHGILLQGLVTVVRMMVVSPALIVGSLVSRSVVGFIVVSPAVVGFIVVSPAVVGFIVVSPAVVGFIVVSPAVVGFIVVSSAVIGFIVVSPAVGSFAVVAATVGNASVIVP